MASSTFKSMERDKASTLRSCSCVQYDRYDVSLLFSINLFYSVNSHNNFYVVHSRAGHGDYNLPIIRHRAHSHRYHSVPQTSDRAIGPFHIIYINNRNSGKNGGQNGGKKASLGSISLECSYAATASVGIPNFS